MTKEELYEALHRCEESLIQAYAYNDTLRRRNGELHAALSDVSNNRVTAREAIRGLESSPGFTRTHFVLKAVNVLIDYHNGHATSKDVAYAAKELAQHANITAARQKQRQAQTKKARKARGRA